MVLGGAIATNVLALSCTQRLLLRRSPFAKLEGNNRVAAHVSTHWTPINPAYQRPPFSLLAKKSCPSKASTSDDPATDQQGDLPVDDLINDQIGSSDEQGVVSSFDWGWVPAFPHAVTASMANFMFGYHIGIMNGPLTSIAHELNFEGDTIVKGFVVSSFLLGAFIGSIGGGVLADKIGRRRTFQVDMIPLILGAALSANAESVNAMIIGRFLVGIGIGVNTGLVPVYISEVAPTRYRGALGSICQIGTCLGIIAVLILGIPSETDPHWWRTLFGIAIIPGILLIIGMQFAVESPRWLSKVGRWEEAESIIRKLWGASNVETAMEELKKSAKSIESTAEISWPELLSERYYKGPAIGSALFALQQFAGINGVLYFSSLTFKDAGITNSMSASAIVALANLLGALSALYLMDRQGRRNCLMGSYTGMAVAMAILFFSLDHNMDQQTSHSLAIAGTLLYVYTFALGAGPVTALIIPEITSTQARAKTMAVSLCVHWVCNFAIGLFFLEFVERFGISTVYASFGVVSLLSVAFSNAFIIETKGRSLEEIEGLFNPARD
eukprot:c23925_g1_i1 orf=362-2026(-)